MLLPTDSPPAPTAPDTTAGLNLIDTPPPVTPEQRDADFNRLFVWRGKQLTFSIASEIFYRELRVKMNAPPLGSYATAADFSAEAPRVLFCASLTAAEIRATRCLPLEAQIELLDRWTEKNIAFHELQAAADLAAEINEAIARARTQPLEEGDTLDSLGN